MIAIQLTQEKKDLISAAIRHHFETQKPYLKHGYSLRVMAEELSITYTFLSYIINREYGMNFNDLVNKYRILHLQKLIKDDASQLYTLEALAFQSGFNSRSTFYRAFYKSTGRMPSAYLKEIQESQLA